MNREELDALIAEIRAIRREVLAELNDLAESEFSLPITTSTWKWDTVLRALLQIGNHMREHATHIQGLRAALDRHPSQPQRILAEAEVAWGTFLAALVGLSDADLDRAPDQDAVALRRILEHVRNSEQDYLAAIQGARRKHTNQ